MNGINDIIKLITKKYEGIPEDKKDRYRPGINLVLGWLAAVDSLGDLIRTCKDCRHAYVPKHAKPDDPTIYCEEISLPKMSDGYCDWFQEEKKK